MNPTSPESDPLFKRILVLCTHNSARSQIGEGWLRFLAQQASLPVEVWSAGTEKTRVKPEALAIMAEVGVDLSSHASKTIEQLPPYAFDAVLTVCDSANQTCPTFPGKTRRYHVSIPDPSGQSLDHWRAARDQIKFLMEHLVEALKADRWPTNEELKAGIHTEEEQ